MHHEYILDTLDGGLVPLLLNLNGRSVPCGPPRRNNLSNKTRWNSRTMKFSRSLALLCSISQSPKKALNANQSLALKHDWSLPDVCRSFCDQWGATVLYWCSQRPDEFDLAVGILRAEEGSMVIRWLESEWGRFSFSEECIDRELCEAWLEKCGRDGQDWRVI